MNAKLITALRAAANAVEDGLFNYEWNYLRSCNCGVVFCSLLQISSADLSKRTKHFYEILDKKNNNLSLIPTWKNVIGTFCPITGMPTDELLKELLSYGLSPKDIIELEYLTNEKVTSKLNIKNIDYCNKSHLIPYLRAWADILIEEGKDDIAEKEQIEETKNINIPS